MTGDLRLFGRNMIGVDDEGDFEVVRRPSRLSAVCLVVADGGGLAFVRDRGGCSRRAAKDLRQGDGIRPGSHGPSQRSLRPTLSHRCAPFPLSLFVWWICILTKLFVFCAVGREAIAAATHDARRCGDGHGAMAGGEPGEGRAQAADLADGGAGGAAEPHGRERGAAAGAAGALASAL